MCTPKLIYPNSEKDAAYVFKEESVDKNNANMARLGMTHMSYFLCNSLESYHRNSQYVLFLSIKYFFLYYKSIKRILELQITILRMLLFLSIKRVILRLFLNKRMTMLQENGTHKIKL